MLTNVSYRDPKQEQVITDLVGKPFNLRMRLKLAGVGSPKLQIVSSSPKSPICFYWTTITMYVISKFDPKELLFDFGVYLKLSPLLFLYKLTIFKGKSTTYAIHSDGQKIEIQANKNTHSFFSKITAQKAKYMQNPT